MVEVEVNAEIVMEEDVVLAMAMEKMEVEENVEIAMEEVEATVTEEAEVEVTMETVILEDVAMVVTLAILITAVPKFLRDLLQYLRSCEYLQILQIHT